MKIHSAESLASAIINALELRQEQAPPNAQLRSIPSQQKVFDTLQSCEEQTAKFNWINLIDAVAAKLEADRDATTIISPVIFRGLVLLFPYVQRFPEDREILVHTRKGFCFLVVWAHHVLGFDTLVSIKGTTQSGHGPSPSSVLFGKFPPTVIIEIPSNSRAEDSVTLIESSSQDTLFSILKEPDDESEISSLVKRPATGIGSLWLRADWDRYAGQMAHGREACTHDMMLMSTALACRLAKNLYKSSPTTDNGLPMMAGALSGPSNKHQGKRISSERLKIPEDRILQAACYLFDIKKISREGVQNYVDAHQNISTHAIPPPATFEAISRLYKDSWNNSWFAFRGTIAHAAALILVFAQTMDLSAANGLLLCMAGTHHFIATEFVASVEEWTGESEDETGIDVDENLWMRCLACLLTSVSSYEQMEIGSASLISAHGWTVYLCGYGNPDPADVGKFKGIIFGFDK